MIISDLNYLEEVNQENAVVGGAGIITVDKDVSFSTTVEQTFDVDVDVNIDKDINANLDSAVNITGNFASLTFDVTASGNNSFTEGDFSIVTTGNLSELSGTFTSAVG